MINSYKIKYEMDEYNLLYFIHILKKRIDKKYSVKKNRQTKSNEIIQSYVKLQSGIKL